MPPKAKRKTNTGAAGRPLVEAESTSGGIQAPPPPPAVQTASRASWQPGSTEVMHVLTHHRLVKPPQTYMDLILPILELVQQRPTPNRRDGGNSTNCHCHCSPPCACCATPTAAAATTAAAPAQRRVTDLEEGSAFEPDGFDKAPGHHRDGGAPAAAPQMPLHRPCLSPRQSVSFFLPKTVATHFQGQRMEGPSPCGAGDKAEVDNGSALMAAAARKRARTDAEDGLDEEESDETLQELVRVLSGASFTQHYLRPYASDAEYLRGLDVGHVLKQWCGSARNLNVSAAFLSIMAKAGLDVFTHLIPGLDAITEVYLAHCRHRLATMPTEPRVVRVARKLGMTDRETSVLAFLLMCHSGSLLAAGTSLTLTLNTLAYYGGLTPQESLDFVSTHRLHIKQGLVTSDVQTRNSFSESRYSMPQEAVAALTGNDLTEEQLIKLERTALADVLNEEKELKQRRQAESAAAAADEAGSPSTCHETTRRERHQHSGDDDEGDSLMLDDDDEDGISHEGGGHVVTVDTADVEEVLGRLGVDLSQLPGGPTAEAIRAALQQRLTGKKLQEDGDDDNVSGSASPATMAPATRRISTGEGGRVDPLSPASTVPESLMHKPYTSDFEYMEEAFKTLASLIRLRTAEGDMKDEDDNFVPRTKIEATMRELKGKVRVSTAVHSSRVAATLALADKIEKEVAQEHGTRTKENATTPSAPADTATTTKTTETGAPADPAVKVGDEKCLQARKLDSDSRAIASGVMGNAQDSDGTSGRAFLPRIEQLSRRLGLSELEKQVMLLMVGSVVSHDILVAINGRYVMRDGQQRYLTVGYILFVLCGGLQERVAARKMFYQAAPLIANGILSLGLDSISSSRSCFNTDLMDYVCDVDRKMVDYVMGSVTETAEMVPGSSLYYPDVPMNNVVLPAQTTKLVLSTIEHYSMFERCKKNCGFGEGLGTTASGLAILFYGPSGTGKTMLANAVAHELKKRLLLVNVSQFKAEKRAPEMMRFIFREAKLNDAIIFFDECESLFESRETNPLVTSVLTEFEKNDGLIILATNMAQVMDEAMNRRISLMVEFKLPSHPMRESIWRRHMPRGVTLASDVSLQKLALNYELSGGLIRNAVLAALNHAIARENTEAPTLHMEDLEEGAKLQLRGFFLAAKRPGGGGGGGGGGGAGGLSGGGSGGGGSGILGSGPGSSEAYLTPRRTLAELVMEPLAKRRVEQVARVSKSRSTLFAQWGFSEEACQDQGSVYLFSGPSGTGKSLAAEGIAYECGATIRLCNVSELLLLQELNVAAVFEEGRQLGAVVVFDEAQELFTHSERAMHISQLIQYYAVRYPKPVIVIATTNGGGGSGGVVGGGGAFGGLSEMSLDVRASRIAFSEHIVFKFPDQALRKELWRSAFPAKVPLADDVDFDKLSERQVSAKLVRRVAFTVCCKAAAAASISANESPPPPPQQEPLQQPQEVKAVERKVSMKMIEDELTRCILAEDTRNPARAMYA